MNASARNARRIVKARRSENKAHKAGLRTLKSHALKAGLTDEIAGGVAGALRSKAKTLGTEGVTAQVLRPGTCEWARNAKRYSEAQFRAVVKAYNPRAAKYVAARELLLSY